MNGLTVVFKAMLGRMNGLALLLLATSAFAAGTPLLEQLEQPLEIRRVGGEETLSIKPALYSVLMLRDTLRLTHNTISDYEGQLSTNSAALLTRTESRLNLPAAEFIAAARAELGLSDKEFAEKPLEGDVKGTHDVWKLTEDELALSKAASLLRDQLLDAVGPELYVFIEAARPRRLAGGVRLLKQFDVSAFNRTLDPKKLTVDIDVHICEGSGLDMELIKSQLLVAREVYARHGLQLRLRSARKIRVPDTWLEISDPLVPAGPRDPLLHERDFYGYFRAKRDELGLHEERVFSAIVKGTPGAEHGIQIITLRHAAIRSWAKDKEGRWEYKEFPTSAVSFPSYIYGDHIPKLLRGVIVLAPMTSTTLTRKPKVYPNTLAHEIGHKLVNVSHEGRETSPQFRTGLGGHRDLMVYGTGADIPAGAAGRWQAERLRLSPYFYRIENGKKIRNPSYKAGGYYDDPIYGSYIVAP